MTPTILDEIRKARIGATKALLEHVRSLDVRLLTGAEPHGECAKRRAQPSMLAGRRSRNGNWWYPIPDWAKSPLPSLEVVPALLRRSTTDVLTTGWTRFANRMM